MEQNLELVDFIIQMVLWSTMVIFLRWRVGLEWKFHNHDFKSFLKILFFSCNILNASKVIHIRKQILNCIPFLSVLLRAWHMALGLIIMKMEILCLEEDGRRESFIRENCSLKENIWSSFSSFQTIIYIYFSSRFSFSNSY